MPTVRPETMAFFDAAPSLTVIRAKLTAQPERVFDALVDAEGWPSWFVNCRSCHYTSGTPGATGSTRQITIGRLRVDEEFIHIERPTIWAFTVTASALPLVTAMAERCELAPADRGGTEIVYTVAMELPRWLQPAQGVITRRVRDSFAESFRTLDSVLRDQADHEA